MSTDKGYCHFCGKDRSGVRKLIAGPSVFICNECVGLCVDILTEDGMTPFDGAEAIQALVLAEREACVRLVEKLLHGRLAAVGGQRVCGELVAALRSRK